MGVAKDVGWFAGAAVFAGADLVADGVIVRSFVGGDEIENEIGESGLRESEGGGAGDGDGVSAVDGASGGLHPDWPGGFVAVWGGGGDGGGGGAGAGDGGGGEAEIGPAVGFGIVGVFVEEIPSGDGGIFEDDGSAAADFDIGPVAGASFCPIVMIDFDIAEASGGAITGEAVGIDLIGAVHGIEADDHSAVGVGVADVAGVIESAIFDEDIARFAEGIGDLPSIGATAHEDEFGVTEIGGEATIIDDAVIDPRLNDGEVAIGVGFVGDIGEAEAADHLGFGGGVVVGCDIEDGDGVTGGGADNFEVFESDLSPEGDDALGVSFAGVIHGDDCGIALALDGDGGDEVDGAGVTAGGISPGGGACGEDDGIAGDGLDVVSVFEVVLGAGGAEDGFGEGLGGEGGEEEEDEEVHRRKKLAGNVPLWVECFVLRESRFDFRYHGNGWGGRGRGCERFGIGPNGAWGHCPNRRGVYGSGKGHGVGSSGRGDDGEWRGRVGRVWGSVLGGGGRD